MTGLGKFAALANPRRRSREDQSRILATVLAAAARVRFVRDSGIAIENLAAERANGRSLCYAAARISTAMQRQFRCECAQQEITTSGVALSGRYE